CSGQREAGAVSGQSTAIPSRRAVFGEPTGVHLFARLCAALDAVPASSGQEAGVSRRTLVRLAGLLFHPGAVKRDAAGAGVHFDEPAAVLFVDGDVDAQLPYV